jgi:hypothetical protein
MVGEQADIEVTGFEFNDDNTSHLARHDVTPMDISAVNGNSPRYFHNLPDRAGSHVMIGPDDRGVWRPVTGWRMTRREALRLYELRGVEDAGN